MKYQSHILCARSRHVFLFISSYAVYTPSTIHVMEHPHTCCPGWLTDISRICTWLVREVAPGSVRMDQGMIRFTCPSHIRPCIQVSCEQCSCS